MHFDYELYTLKNGMQILLVPSDTTYTLTVSANIKSGSAFENKSTQGITHFVEHMALSSTESWPDKLKFNEAIEFNGAEMNGETGKEILRYYINVPYNKAEFGVKFIYETLYRARFDEESIEQERTVILDEISKYHDEPEFLASVDLYEKLLNKKTAYSKEIIGTKETVSNFSQKDLLDAYKLAHSPNKILLSVIGNFKTDEVKKLINQYFENVETVSNKALYPEDEFSLEVISAKKHDKSNLIITNIGFQIPGLDALSIDQDVLLTLSNACLAIPMSSRLKHRLRIQEGLLYSIYPINRIFRKFGSIGIGFSIEENKFEKAFTILFEELDRFNKGITESELKHYKEFTINRNLANHDEIYSYASIIRGQIFNEREKVYTLEEMNNKIKAITTSEINAFIKSTYKTGTAFALAFGNTNSETQGIMESVIKKYK